MASIPKDIFLKHIATTIKRYRKQQNITLEIFYFDTGIHLARIEQGKNNVSIFTLKRICSYLNITLEEFFKDFEEELNK